MLLFFQVSFSCTIQLSSFVTRFCVKASRFPNLSRSSCLHLSWAFNKASSLSCWLKLISKPGCLFTKSLQDWMLERKLATFLVTSCCWSLEFAMISTSSNTIGIRFSSCVRDWWPPGWFMLIGFRIPFVEVMSVYTATRTKHPCFHQTSELEVLLKQWSEVLLCWSGQTVASFIPLLLLLQKILTEMRLRKALWYLAHAHFQVSSQSSFSVEKEEVKAHLCSVRNNLSY